MKFLKLSLFLCILFTTTHSFSQNTNMFKASLPIDKKTNCFIRYYYYPNLEAYFDNLKMVYYYFEDGDWQTAEELPTNYGGYSLFNKTKVIITDYDEENPQQFLKVHKKKYPYNAKGRFSEAKTSSN